MSMELSIRFLSAVTYGVAYCLRFVPFKNAGKELCFNVGALIFCGFKHQRRLRRVYTHCRNELH